MIYVIVCWTTKRTLSTRLRYNLLRTAVVFFIFPFPEFKYLLPEPLLEMWEPDLLVKAVSYPTGEGITIGGYYEQPVSFGAAVSWACIIVSGFLAAISVFVQVRSCRRTKRIYQNSSTSFDIHDYIDCHKYEEIKREIGITRKIEFLFSNRCPTPLTIGILSPMVVFPTEMIERTPEEWDFLIRHELNHIKSHDLFIKFLGYVIRYMHFLNPAAHLLYFELCKMCEIHCDAKTVKSYDEAMRKRYCHCMVRWAESAAEKAEAVPLGFANSRSDKIIRRRILEMKQGKQKKSIITILAALAIAFTGSSAVLAFEPANEVDLLQGLNPDKNYTTYGDMNAAVDDSSSSDRIFVDQDGNVCDVNGNEKVLCFHKYNSIVIAEHSRNSDGSCVTLYYDAQQCTKCGTIKNMEYSGGKTTFEKCPH